MTIPTSGSSVDLARVRDAQLDHAELLTLAAHAEPAVRAAVASRPDCPIAALTSLGYDRSLDVLGALLANPRTPASVVRRLADHRDPRVSELAVQRLRNSFR